MQKILSLLALVLAGLALALSVGSRGIMQQAPEKAETAFERVLRTGVLRCAYYDYPPWVSKDPNTGDMRGLGVEYVNQLTAALGLKPEWTEEVTFGTWSAGLQAGRFDAVCPGIWVDANQSRVVSFTAPLWYAVVYAFARNDDRRFDGNLGALDRPDVTITTVEGDSIDFVARQRFPQAHILAMPPNTDYTAVVQNVVSGKADIVLWDESGMNLFRKNNPGTLHTIAPDQPVRATETAIPVRAGELQLRDMLSVGIRQLQTSGITDRILDRFEQEAGPTGNLRVARPYNPAPATP